MSDNRGVEIRPEVTMYTAFARLSPEPWYVAEFGDNALQRMKAAVCWLSRRPSVSARPLRVGHLSPHRSW
jgi:hypothetical protein